MTTTIELNRGFDHKLARVIGADKATMISQISYWTERTNNLHKGYKWVYNTAKDWQVQFDWLSVKTVQRYLKSLEQMGLLISDNFNKWKIDRTKWYRVNYDKLAELLGETEEVSDSPNNVDTQSQCNGTISPNGKEPTVPTNNHKITQEITQNINKSQINNSQSQSVDRKTEQQQPTKSNRRYYQQFKQNKQTTKPHYYYPKKTVEKATDWSKHQAEKVDVDVNALKNFFVDFEAKVSSGQLQA